MKQIMRIGTSMLTGGKFGSIELPAESEDLCCPQCGTLVADRGQCSVQFIEWPSKDGDKEVNVIKMIVDCRCCYCVDKEPMFRKTWELLHSDRI